MSLFPNESYSFPDLSEGAKAAKRGKHAEPDHEPSPPPDQPPPPVPAQSAETMSNNKPNATWVPPQNYPATPIFPQPQEPVQRVHPNPPAAPNPVMPLMPVVPDELRGLQPLEPIPDEFDEELQPLPAYAEPEPSPVETFYEHIPDFEIPDRVDDRRLSRRRKRNKLFRFLFMEALAVGLLLGSIKMAIAERASENSLTLLYEIGTFVAAIAVALIPVFFYALPPTLPPTRR